jgi:hypothetical protein
VLWDAETGGANLGHQAITPIPVEIDGVVLFGRNSATPPSVNSISTGRQAWRARISGVVARGHGAIFKKHAGLAMRLGYCRVVKGFQFSLDKKCGWTLLITRQMQVFSRRSKSISSSANFSKILSLKLKDSRR